MLGNRSLARTCRSSSKPPSFALMVGSSYCYFLRLTFNILATAIDGNPCATGDQIVFWEMPVAASERRFEGVAMKSSFWRRPMWSDWCSRQVLATLPPGEA